MLKLNNLKLLKKDGDFELVKIFHRMFIIISLSIMYLIIFNRDTFIMEYVGEVIDPFDFHKRVEKYAKQKLEHHYFMALKADEIIDATCKGNVTRFVNHSCEPNSRTQKV